MTSTADMLAPPPAPPPTITDAALARPSNLSEHMAAALVSHGVMTRSQIDEGLAAQASGVPSALVEDHPFAHIEPGFRPPEKPSQYHLPVAPRGVEFPIPLERGIRTIAHAAGLDQGFVHDLVERGYQAALAPRKTEAEREMQQRISKSELGRAWGLDYEQNMATTQAFVADLIQKHPPVKTLLEANGLGDHPAVIRQLFSRAKARKGP